MFDTLRFLRENFVDIDGVLHLVSKHAHVDLPQRAAVTKWFQRASVPGDWFPIILMVAEAEVGHIDLGVYTQRPDENDIFA